MRDQAKIKENPKNPQENIAINSDNTIKSTILVGDVNRIS